MWSRIVRALTALLHAYSFYSNPFRYIISLLALLVIPYLVYLFWGGVFLVLAFIAGAYFLYRYVKATEYRSNKSPEM